LLRSSLGEYAGRLPPRSSFFFCCCSSAMSLVV
jgi:hypothetical protein